MRIYNIDALLVFKNRGDINGLDSVLVSLVMNDDKIVGGSPGYKSR